MVGQGRGQEDKGKVKRDKRKRRYNVRNGKKEERMENEMDSGRYTFRMGAYLVICIFWLSNSYNLDRARTRPLLGMLVVL